MKIKMIWNMFVFTVYKKTWVVKIKNKNCTQKEAEVEVRER